jgi:hypothetical protein
MGVRVTSIAFANELKAQTTNWLLGNRKDKITATINLTVETVAISSNSNPFIIKNTDGYVGDHWVTANNNDFADFQIGDTVVIFDTTTNTVEATTDVIDKLSDNEIKLTLNISPYGFNTQTSTVRIYVTTPITALRFKYNTLENNQNPDYFSFLTGQLQEAIIEEKLASDTSTSNMLLMGGKEWQNGSVQVKGVSITTTVGYQSNYQIIHTFFIENWNKFNDDADRYINGNCLKYIYEITALYEFTNPNRLQQVISNEVLGNTGNYNENFNNRPTNYTVASVTYSSGTEIELTTNETTFTAVITNTTDTPFSNNNTKFVLHFGRVPDQIDYTSNSENIDANFWNDRLVQTVGSAAINGINFGTDTQVFKDVVATFNSTSQITITGKIALASAIATSEPYAYEFSVSVQNHTLATADADKVTLLLDRNEFFVDTADPGMIVVEREGYIPHPYNDFAVLNATPTVFPYDEAVSYVLAYIDLTGRETDSILLSTIVPKIVAFNSVSGASFNLELDSFNLSGASLVNGYQFFDIVAPRQYQIPSNEIRKQIAIKRRTDLDTSSRIFFEVAYPYQIRWEYWTALNGVNGAFFNTGQPNNGFNNNWLRYDSAANWSIKFELQINATKNGSAQRYETSHPIEVVDFLSNTAFINETLRTKLTSSNTDITPFIAEYQDCYAEAKFTLLSGTFDLINTVVVFFIEQFEQGGINGKQRMSSNYTVIANSLYKDTVTLSLDNTNTILTAIAPINIAQFANLQGDFTIVARLFYPAFEDGKQFEDEEFFQFQDNDIFQFN